MKESKKIFNCLVCGGEVLEKKSFFGTKILCRECKTTYSYDEGNGGYSLDSNAYLSGKLREKYDDLRERFPSGTAYLTPKEIAVVNSGGLTQKEEDTKKRMEVEESLLEKISSGDLSGLPAVDLSEMSVLMKRGEKALLALPHSVSLVEERVRYEYQGGSQGVSLRIMKGVSYRIGGFKGHRVPIEEQKVLDVGSLVITNKRVIFTGPKKSTVFNISKIIGVEVYDDGIRINREGKQKAEYFYADVGSGAGTHFFSYWDLVKAVIAGVLQGHD